MGICAAYVSNLVISEPWTSSSRAVTFFQITVSPLRDKRGAIKVSKSTVQMSQAKEDFLAATFLKVFYWRSRSEAPAQAASEVPLSNSPSAIFDSINMEQL